MNIRYTLVGGVLAATLAVRAQGNGCGDEPRLTVHLVGSGIVFPAVLEQARDTTARILADAGIVVVWRGGVPAALASCGMTVAVRFSLTTPAQIEKQALGVTRLRPKPAIFVFYWRILRDPNLEGPLMGHVMAHELVHLLQGVPRHSDRGLMKAFWDRIDQQQMLVGFLPLDGIDIDWLRARPPFRKTE